MEYTDNQDYVAVPERSTPKNGYIGKRMMSSSI